MIGALAIPPREYARMVDRVGIADGRALDSIQIGDLLDWADPFHLLHDGGGGGGGGYFDGGGGGGLLGGIAPTATALALAFGGGLLVGMVGVVALQSFLAGAAARGGG